MERAAAEPWRHEHVFGHDRATSNERRTRIVVGITAATMALELAAGLWTGSMALLADGVHMASHALALGIAAAAYAYARRHARDERFSLGTGKVNALAGFAGALILGIVAVGMAWGSVAALIETERSIAFDEAIAIAVIGLAINVASMFVLGGSGHAHEHGHDHGHGHGHGHGDGHDRDRDRAHGRDDREHGHDRGHGDGHDHGHAHGHDDHHHDDPHGHGHDARLAHDHAALVAAHAGHGHEIGCCAAPAAPPPEVRDHNLRSAYLHVLADALTSVFAIVALVAGKYLGLGWLDPLVGVLGAILVGRWSINLVRDTSSVLLDHQAPGAVRDALRSAICEGPDRVTDLHVWAIGPGMHAAVVSIVSASPQPPACYVARVPRSLGIRHLTVEVHRDHRRPARRGSV